VAASKSINCGSGRRPNEVKNCLNPFASRQKSAARYLLALWLIGTILLMANFIPTVGEFGSLYNVATSWPLATMTPTASFITIPISVTSTTKQLQ
jgi:hypothetical protein